MVSRLLLLALPALTLATFWLKYEGNFDVHSFYSTHNISGRQVDIINGRERAAFRIGDRNLKNGVRAYFGRLPDDAFLRSPTPWGDLYMTYNWDQVNRTVVLESLRILSVVIESSVPKQQVFENKEIPTANSTLPPLMFNVGISESVVNRVNSSWSMSGKLSVPQDVSHDIKIVDTALKEPVTFSFTSGWGVGAEQSKAVTIGNSSVEIRIQPGQAVISELHAARLRIRLELKYVASLSGDVAVNYDDTYKCHHYWSLPVKEVMSHGRLNNEVVAYEIIDIRHFTRSSIIVRDMKNLVIVYSVSYTPVQG